MFLKTRVVKGIEYFYACVSYVREGKQEQKDVYYFGNRKPTKYEWGAVLAAIEGKDVYEPKEAQMRQEQKERVEGLGKRMKSELAQMSASEREKFYEMFYNDYIYNTNSIEGSTLSKDETFFVTREKQGVEGKSLKEIYMARNLMAAIEFLEKYDGELNVSLVKKLHEIVQEDIQQKEELGQFKRRQNYIIGTEFLPTPPNMVEERMDGLLRWIGINRKKYYAFELAALFHLKFVGIHPFIDGNGRVARLLHNFMLKQSGLVPIVYHAKTKQKYYSALRAAQIYGSHRQFLDYSLEEFVATYESA